jgi:hypothetical protein
MEFRVLNFPAVIIFLYMASGFFGSSHTELLPIEGL